MTADLRLRLASAASILALTAPGLALAQATAGAKPEVEVPTVVVTAAKGNASTAAPVKSSLEATEPVAVITRKDIEEATPRVGDYTTTAIFGSVDGHRSKRKRFGRH